MSSTNRQPGNRIKCYNERRLDSALGYRTPSETRRAWLERIAMAA